MKTWIRIIFLVALSSCNGPKRNGPEKVSGFAAAVKSSVETTDGIIYFSMNNGLTWENKSNGLPDSITIGLGAIAVSDQSLGIATKGNGIYVFDFRRDLWVNIPTDEQMIKSNLGTLAFFKDRIYVGTPKSGVFSSADKGNNWTTVNAGFTNLTIRKLIQIGDQLYAGTDAGLYSYREADNKWKLEYGNSTMQVNGITEFNGNIYIGTNQGAFASCKDRQEWKQVLANRSLHNISSDEHTIYAMTYNELLSSTDNGLSWQNIQKGLPANLYTFNVLKHGQSVFAGQWDGVYRKDRANEIWKLSGNGLPKKLAITNMKLYNGIMVVSGAQRVLRKGVNTDKNTYP